MALSTPSADVPALRETVGRRPTRRARVTDAPHRLVVVSNRVASAHKSEASTGGLANAVLAALKQSGGIWFGWNGDVVPDDPGPPAIEESGGITYATIALSRVDYDEYYAGFANRVLWPLFHYRPSLVEYKRQELESYLRVNRCFADKLQPLLNPGDLIWVHDYHLIPLGQQLRARGVTQPIGFFLHTPFPASEVLRILPSHREMVEALCAYDIVGFHTVNDLDSFRDYLLREAGGEDLGGSRLAAFGRVFRAEVFPIGIDVERVAAEAALAAGSRQTRRLTDSLAGRELIIGVDRLDYSKGLQARFQAFERLIQDHPETRGHVTYMQIAPPTRSDVPEYLEIRRSLETASGHINGRFAEFDWTPIRYLNKSFNQRTLAGFLRTGRVGLVTPFRDGMNLVAKEYVAAQDPDDPGVLVLSCFAGAARELDTALLVNPWDLDGMADALARGLAMPLEERQERWNEMMRALRRNDIAAWRDTFVRRLTETGDRLAA
jgi:trehalose 6-phosphate synthase